MRENGRSKRRSRASSAAASAGQCEARRRRRARRIAAASASLDKRDRGALVGGDERADLPRGGLRAAARSRCRRRHERRVFGRASEVAGAARRGRDPSARRSSASNAGRLAAATASPIRCAGRRACARSRRQTRSRIRTKPSADRPRRRPASRRAPAASARLRSASTQRVDEPRREAAVAPMRGDQHHRDPADRRRTAAARRSRRARRAASRMPNASPCSMKKPQSSPRLVPAGCIRQRRPPATSAGATAPRARARSEAPSRTSNLVGLPRLGRPRATQSATQSSMRPSGTSG